MGWSGCGRAPWARSPTSPARPATSRPPSATPFRRSSSPRRRALQRSSPASSTTCAHRAEARRPCRGPSGAGRRHADRHRHRASGLADVRHRWLAEILDAEGDRDTAHRLLALVVAIPRRVNRTRGLAAAAAQWPSPDRRPAVGRATRRPCTASPPSEVGHARCARPAGSAASRPPTIGPADRTSWSCDARLPMGRDRGRRCPAHRRTQRPLVYGNRGIGALYALQQRLLECNDSLPPDVIPPPRASLGLALLCSVQLSPPHGSNDARVA